MHTYGKGALAVKRNVPTTDYRTPRMRARAVNEQLKQIVHEFGSEMGGENRAVLAIKRALADEWSEVAAFCAANRHRLHEREYYFVMDMVAWTGRGRSLSPKQQQWLRAIRDRLGGRQ